MRNCAVREDNGWTDLTWKARKSTGLLQGTRYSMPKVHVQGTCTGSLSLVSRTVNQQGLSQIWNSLVFFIVDKPRRTWVVGNSG